MVQASLCSDFTTFCSDLAMVVAFWWSFCGSVMSIYKLWFQTPCTQIFHSGNFFMNDTTLLWIKYLKVYVWVSCLLQIHYYVMNIISSFIGYILMPLIIYNQSINIYLNAPPELKHELEKAVTTTTLGRLQAVARCKLRYFYFSLKFTHQMCWMKMYLWEYIIGQVYIHWPSKIRQH